jgi:hypothetical protein
MTLKKTAIYAAALVAATIASQLAQAGSKGTPNGGVSSSAPGNLPPPTSGPTEPGKSANAPGDIKKDTSLPNASTISPGSTNPNKK